MRCAIYTRKSTEEGLAQEFTSLDAQRDSAEAYILSQREAGWSALPEGYDDGGFTGANLERPALRRLLIDMEDGRIECVLVYKIDRLSRSLLDFARLMGEFEKRGISLVSVTQQFNTTASLGRLTLNILLSFAQFERELIVERTRDKMAAARRRGKWVGGIPVLGYDVAVGGGKLVVNEEEAREVRAIFGFFLRYRDAHAVVELIQRRGWTTKSWTTKEGKIASRTAHWEKGIDRASHKCSLCRKGCPSGAELCWRTRRDRRRASLAKNAETTSGKAKCCRSSSAARSLSTERT
jgi:site-specific DNA recombinase